MTDDRVGIPQTEPESEFKNGLRCSLYVFYRLSEFEIQTKISSVFYHPDSV